MQDGGSPDTSLGSPAAAAAAAGGDDSAPGSPDGGDYVPFVPLPWENNATDGPYYPGGRVPLPWPTRSGSRAGSSRAFGGLLSLILLHVLLVTSMAW